METTITVLPQETEAAIKKDSAELQKKVFELTINSNEENQVAGTLLIAVGQRKKRLEALKEEKNRKLLDEIATNRKYFKFFEEPIEKMDKFLRDGMNAYARKVWQEEQKRAAEEAERIRKEQAEAAAAAKKSKKPVEPVEAIVPVAPKPSEDLKVRTELGGVGQKRRWTFELIDLSKVPAEYLMINEKAVNEAIRSGEREIEGLRIFETVDTVVR